MRVVVLIAAVLFALCSLCFASQNSSSVLLSAGRFTEESGAADPGPALSLTLLSDAASREGAVCLDGTPAGYYYRPGVGAQAQNFVVYIEGYTCLPYRIVCVH